MNKPTIPKGTRDFGPDVVRKRNHILGTIRRTFELYGFQPLETPAMENLSTLTGKYGEEGDQLMFKILNNGDIFSAAQQAGNSRELVSRVSEKALRYDLTIPFARYVVMNQHELAFPFKRYQIQPVWRADRPQKGRYREFYQCDADVVGSSSLLNEVELLAVYDQVFHRLGLRGYTLRINNRKILSALADRCGKPEQLTAITVAIDKLDKIGAEGVKKELAERGLSGQETAVIERFLSIQGNNEEKLDRLRELFAGHETGLKGIEELSYVLHADLAARHTVPVLDPTLARGLNYYTGIIIEANAPATVKIGSIGGGGRYDDLTGLFGLTGLSGVGISFGVDRIYDVLEALQLFPEAGAASTRILFLHLGDDSIKTAFPLMEALRDRDIPAEIFPDPLKLDKQLKYAAKRGIPHVAIIGEQELQENTVSLKNLETGHQEKIPQAQLANRSF
ncbi:histidine--tRNA ligase [Compostibacter hankyongensis]|uniref:Histidine--tRNA ligase n=1 Tax=Compostibacter hankyongensis TaxID=1007089 RepID=A0ABP8FGN5_9BACT